MSQDPTAPITVNGSAAPGQITSALRTFLTAFVAYAAGKGWIDSQLGMAGAGLLLVLLPAALSQYSAWSKHRTLVAVATASDVRVT